MWVTRRKNGGLTLVESSLKNTADFKIIASCKAVSSDTLKFCFDNWRDRSLAQFSPELFSFAKCEHGSLALMINVEDIHNHFLHLYQPKLMISSRKLIKSFLQPLHGNQNPDMWWCINGNRKYSLIAVYNSLKVGAEAHIIFKWLWQGANRVRHTIFFWMLLKKIHAVGIIWMYHVHWPCRRNYHALALGLQFCWRVLSSLKDKEVYHLMRKFCLDVNSFQRPLL